MKRIRVKLTQEGTVPVEKKRKLSKSLNRLAEIDKALEELKQEQKNLLKTLDHDMRELSINRYETKFGVAEYISKRANSMRQIDPLEFHNICPDDMTFYSCVKVQISAAEKKISPKILEEVTQTKPGEKKPPELQVTRKNS